MVNVNRVNKLAVIHFINAAALKGTNDWAPVKAYPVLFLSHLNTASARIAPGTYPMGYSLAIQWSKHWLSHMGTAWASIQLLVLCHRSRHQSHHRSQLDPSSALITQASGVKGDQTKGILDKENQYFYNNFTSLAYNLCPHLRNKIPPKVLLQCPKTRPFS